MQKSVESNQMDKLQHQELLENCPNMADIGVQKEQRVAYLEYIHKQWLQVLSDEIKRASREELIGISDYLLEGQDYENQLIIHELRK